MNTAAIVPLSARSPKELDDLETQIRHERERRRLNRCPVTADDLGHKALEGLPCQLEAGHEGAHTFDGHFFWLTRTDAA